MENHIDAYLLVRTTFHGRSSSIRLEGYAQDMAQIRFRINVVQKASADKPIQQCTALAAEEHKVFISETDGTKGFFRGIMSASA